MIRLTKMTDYGIVLLSHITRQGAGVHSARDLAVATHVPLPMVSKILKALSRAALLVPQRGAKGGYRLARPAESITVAEIIAALEGPIAMTECAGADHSHCSIELLCPVRSNWLLINDVVHEALDRIVLADLARPRMLARPAMEAAPGPARAGGVQGFQDFNV